MPYRVRCSKCKNVIYEEDDSSVKPLTYIIKRFDGKCPECGKNFGPTLTVSLPLDPKNPKNFYNNIPEDYETPTTEVSLDSIMGRRDNMMDGGRENQRMRQREIKNSRYRGSRRSKSTKNIRWRSSRPSSKEEMEFFDILIRRKERDKKS